MRARAKPLFRITALHYSLTLNLNLEARKKDGSFNIYKLIEGYNLFRSFFCERGEPAERTERHAARSTRLPCRVMLREGLATLWQYKPSKRFLDLRLLISLRRLSIISLRLYVHSG